ncbi:MAG: heat-inducible transcriptional repressor HrcA [Actinomycetia bacterium]|nr:heat-inducible transcriptional repressor HrcA [Actinomycetes bacterium]
MLDDRKSRVLKALVEEYIRTGEPVSSQTVLDRSGLDVSSATVRNDLSRLESYGFVSQPHTSAGRLPTHQGYRFYVDHLSPVKLREATRGQIDEFFREVHKQISEMLRESSTLVSELTSYPAVVVGPGASSDIIDDIRLVPLGGSTVLVVAVAENGRVHQEYVDVGTDVSAEMIEEAERLVSAAFHGHSLESPETDGLKRSDLPAVVKRIVAPISEQLTATHSSEREVHVGGTSRMAALWNDLTMVRYLLKMLDEEASLIDLMSDESTGTNVRFGPDLGDETDLAIITATYETPSGAMGKVGVIGPMRMNYRRAIKVVEEVSDGLEESFGGSD